MYDTITFRLHQDECDFNLLEQIPKYLIDIRETCYENGAVSISGRLDSNLNFTVSQTALKLTKGSIAKYYLGDNIQTLTRKDSELAFESLSDKLHVNLSKSKLIRVDVANNILTKYPETNYFKYLGDLQNFERLEQPNGLYYQNHKSDLLFYGKLKEQKKKGNPIPEWLNDKNMLRYELRLKNRIHFQMEHATEVDQLYEETFYMKLLDKYASDYGKIRKQQTILSGMKPGGIKELEEQSLAILINLNGLNSVTQMVDEWKSTGQISRKLKSDLKRKINDAASIFPADEKNELIEELDRKIIDSVMYYR